MTREVILKKLEQIKELVAELERLLQDPFDAFVRNLTVVRAAERNFQLVVDTASDINTQLLLERGGKTPDTYRQSFIELAAVGVLSPELAEGLGTTARVRNILVHEYDFEEDYRKFYDAARGAVPLYREYISRISAHLASAEA